LTKEEIEKVAKVFKSFVDPANKVTLGHVIQYKFHRETWWEFHKLCCRHYSTPAYNDYNVDKYIEDKGLSKKAPS
jgi:hypothetical protein